MIFITIFYKPFFINLQRFYIVLYFIYYYYLDYFRKKALLIFTPYCKKTQPWNVLVRNKIIMTFFYYLSGVNVFLLLHLIMIIIIVGVVAVATEPYYMTPAIREKKREWVEYLFSNKTNQTLHVHRSSAEAMKKNNIWWLSEGASQSERAQHLTQSSKRTQTHMDFFLTTQFEWTKTPAPWFSDFPSSTHKQNKTEHTTSHTNAQTFAYIF